MEFFDMFIRILGFKHEVRRAVKYSMKEPRSH